MGQIPYSEFKRRVLARIWPNSDPQNPGPENLQVPLESFVQSALATVYQHNTCLQEENFSVHPQCSTYYRCGLTVVPNRPPGVIKRVWTVAGNQCSPFTYVQLPPDELRSWSADLQRTMTETQRATVYPPAPPPEPVPPPTPPSVPGGSGAAYTARRGDFWPGPTITLQLKPGTDMSGATVRSQLRRTPGSATVVFDFVAAGHMEVASDAAKGTMTLTPSIPEDVTDDLTGSYVADVEVSKPGVLNPITIYSYTITFFDDVSRP